MLEEIIEIDNSICLKHAYINDVSTCQR